jgi:hypothetical protein
VLGAADASREPQGRTSGSSASVRARGPEPGQVGLALPEVVATAERGQRYVASAWVRSSASGQQVAVRLAGAGPLRLEVVADGVPAGDALLVDEVVVRLG